METKLPNIKIGSILLKEVERSDFVSLYRVGSNPNLCTYLNWGPFKKMNEALYMLDNMYLNRPEDYNIPKGYSIIIDDDFRGIVDYHTYDKNSNSIEIGYFLEESYWHKGIMHKILLKVIYLAFNYLDVDKIIIKTMVENKRNISLILSLGFQYESYQMGLIDDDEYRLLNVYSLYKINYGGIK